MFEVSRGADGLFTATSPDLAGVFVALGVALLILSLIFGSIHRTSWFGVVMYALGIALILIACALTSADRRSKDVRVLPIIVAELELRDIQDSIIRMLGDDLAADNGYCDHAYPVNAHKR